MKIALLAIASASLFASSANAAVDIYVNSYTNGSDWGVLAQTTGSLNVTGFTRAVGSATLVPGIKGDLAYLFTGKPGAFSYPWGPSTLLDSFTGLTGPSDIGATLATGASFGTGDGFGFNTNGGKVFVPTGYVSGSAINSTATWQYLTLAGAGAGSLDLTIGTYVYSLGSDTITLHIGTSAPVAPVPEPASWALMICGLGAVGAALRGRRKTAIQFG
jgi:hypothetical protein